MYKAPTRAFENKTLVGAKIEKQIQILVKNTVILDRRYLDDEQLDRRNQLKVSKEIFDADVRDSEIREFYQPTHLTRFHQS